MSARNFALPPIGKPALVFAFVLGLILPLVVAVFVVWLARGGELPATVALMLQAVVAMAILALLLPMWRRQVAIDGRHLRVKATYYTRSAELGEFDLANARIVDLRERGEWRPAVKTNGFALPGFWAGHFRLRDWRRKAFCLVTDASKVLALPHADGRVWLLSFEHPQAVLDILRRAG
jgi:hypothetical protein